MNTKFAMFLAALIVSLPMSYASASEALKIGYVNTQRIFRDAPTAVKAAKKIETEFSKRDQDLQRLAKQLQTLQDSLEKSVATMAEAERRTKEKDLNELSREFQRKQREFYVIGAQSPFFTQFSHSFDISFIRDTNISKLTFRDYHGLKTDKYFFLCILLYVPIY